MTKETSNSIVLRALEPDDIDILYKWENDRSIWEVSNTIAPFSRFILTKYLESAHFDIFQTRQLRLMIDLIEHGSVKTIGAIDLFDFEPMHQRAGVGILIGDKTEKGKGYAKLALEELKKYVFEVLHLNQLYCNISVDNIISIQLFKSHGFIEVGVKKQWVKTSNGFSDEVLLQLINPSNFKVVEP